MSALAGWSSVAWEGTFAPDMPVELALRGSLVYLALFALLRVVRTREAGAIGLADLLVLVVIADAAQNALAGGYTSLSDGLVLIGVIAFWSYALDWLGYRFRAFERVIRPRPLPLVRDGRLLRWNPRRELITEEEVLSQLRLQGYADLTTVREAVMESDGRISVAPHNQAESAGAPEQRVG